MTPDPLANEETAEGIPSIAFLDRTVLQLWELASSDAVWESRRTASNELGYLIQRKIPGLRAGKGERLSGDEVLGYLERCGGLIAAELVQSCRGYSAFRWLWYLRRLPRTAFEAAKETSFSYDAILAEVVTGLGGEGCEKPVMDEGGTRFPLNNAVVRRVLRLAASVRYLSEIHRLFRMAAKGIEFRVAGSPLPVPVPTKEQWDAVEIYDTRIAAMTGVNMASRMGTRFEADWETGTRASGVVGAGYLREDGPLVVPVWTEAGERTKAEVWSRFGPYVEKVDNLYQLLSDPRIRWLPKWDEAGALLLLLTAAPSLFYRLHSPFESIASMGYVVVHDGIIERWLNETFEETAAALRDAVPRMRVPGSVEDWLRELEEGKGVIWPLKPGPVVRRLSGGVAFDWHCATRRLDALLEFPRTGGADGDVRGQHFEDAVQRSIDRSPWCPADELRALRRRHLRLGGERISDVDAIGALGDRVLLVSCKSVIYSGAYDKGERRSVENVAGKIVDSVMEWRNVCEQLLKNPLGDNYDLSRFRQVIGVVCAPYPAYVPVGIATEFLINGLRTACTLSELEEWLRCFERGDDGVISG